MPYTEEQKEKQRLYSARYRLRKKGMDLPPETLAEIEALRAKKKAEGLERRREANRRWNREHKEQRAARTRERYQSDPEFREHKLALAKAARDRRKPVLTDAQKAKRLQQRREAQVKATRASAAKAAQLRQAQPPTQKPKAPPKPDVLTDTQKAAPKWKLKKPGRLMAICGWHGL